MKLMVNIFEVNWSSTALTNYFIIHHFLTLLNNKYGFCVFYSAFTDHDINKSCEAKG